MELLYKYYSNESTYVYENLENKNICFTPLESLNDPFEGVGEYLYEVDDEEQKFWDSINSDLPKLLSKKFSKDFQETANFKYRVFCSSKEYDNPLLWAYYANSHKGFCIGYEKNSIVKVSDKIFDVEYKKQMYPINKYDVETFEKILSIKSIDWSNENECRALYELKNDDIERLNAEVFLDEEKKSDKKLYKPHGHVQTNNLQTLCSEKFILKECSPVVIYFGMRMKLSDKQRLMDIANKLQIKAYQMSQEQDCFKFIPESII